MGQDDRRRSPRRQLRMRIDYKAGDGDFLFEYTKNISKGGLFIGTDTPMEIGTELQLRFNFPEADTELDLEGLVVWLNAPKDGQEHPNPGMGVQFVNLSDEDRDLLSQLVGAIAYL